MAAAALAAKLMDAYALTFTDLELGDTTCTTAKWSKAQRDRHPVESCAVAVAEFTDTRVWRDQSVTGAHQANLFGGVDRVGVGTVVREIVFFGLPQDVEQAVYLLGICAGAMTRGLSDWIAERDAAGVRTTDQQRADFCAVMATLLSKKLRAIKAEQRAATARSSGRDLVVTKEAILARAPAERGITFPSHTKRKMRAVDDAAVSAADAAAARVHFHRGVNASGQLAAIGGK